MSASASREPAPGNRRGLLAAVLACYAGLVCCLWAWYGLRSGLGYETGLVVPSQGAGLLQGFIYVDPLRLFTRVFYHLSYLLAKAAGTEGSFVAYQIVYAALWTARGFLVFLIVRELVGSPVLAYTAGALTVFHASDLALNWVGQMNQFGFIFWTLLSFYFYLLAIQARRRTGPAVALALAGTVCAGLSLGSYESPLPMILAFPPLAMLLFSGIDRRRLALSGVYYLVPAAYLAVTVFHYSRKSRSASYQVSVLRQDWDPSALLRDWLFNLKESTFFWRWQDTLSSAVPHPLPAISIGLCVAIFAFGAVAVHRFGAAEPESADRRRLLALCFTGFSLLALSFPAYLLLSSAASAWRTQMLSGPGTGILLAAMAGLAASFSSRRAWRTALLVAFGSVVAAYGTHASLKAAYSHWQVWEKHRSTMARVLRVAPAVKPGTLIVLTNVTPEVDGFGDNMWFNLALRLCYPGTPVAGTYFLPGGAAPPGGHLALRGGTWRETGVWDIPPVIGNIGLSSTIIIDAGTGGQFRLLETIPDFLRAEASSPDEYRPREHIGAGPPSPLAIRRYSPIVP